MKTPYLYITIGIIGTVTVIFAYNLLKGTETDEEILLPKVHLHLGAKKADYELIIKTELKPPKPNQYVGRPMDESQTKTQQVEEIETLILAEEPDIIYSMADVDEPAQPKRDLTAICSEIEKNNTKLIACKSTVIRMELIIHHGGQLLDWKPLTPVSPICEEVLLTFISKVQYWTPALVDGKPVSQRLSLHIHFK